MPTSDSPSGPGTPLTGKVALVLGASRGIGAATARALARQGARVVLASRDRTGLERVRASILADGGDALVQPVDLTDPVSLDALRDRLTDTCGRLDCAFNNAGEGAPPTPLAEVAPDVFERVLRVTVHGTFLAMRQEIPLLVRSGGGAIVNMASTAGVSAFPGGGAYVAAKHAVIGLTKSAAIDYAAQGVRVNVVAPGPIETERILALPGEYRERIRQAVPMRRIGRPEEVARAVAWLCSDESAFVTGATIFVDGGRMAGTG
jgi:NAD(P)-dependent dehydrogenase (short-subunit alcohol dehydrogenase family)